MNSRAGHGDAAPGAQDRVSRPTSRDALVASVRRGPWHTSGCSMGRHQSRDVRGGKSASHRNCSCRQGAELTLANAAQGVGDFDVYVHLFPPLVGDGHAERLQAKAHVLEAPIDGGPRARTRLDDLHQGAPEKIRGQIDIHRPQALQGLL
jgi:hypothetical protein